MVTEDATPSRNSVPTTPTRLWRPAAQRNLRNQWSELASARDKWTSKASEGRSVATTLVNAYLSQRYLPEMNLGVLKDMKRISDKACLKLARKQDVFRVKLLSSYRDMVHIVSNFVKSSGSMRCFRKGSAISSLIQFCSSSEDENDLGDGGGVLVFTSWPIQHFEKMAQELADMFVLELSLKRLIVVELLAIRCKEALKSHTVLNWTDELYPGEYEDLSLCNLLDVEKHQPMFPEIKNFASVSSIMKQPDSSPSEEVLQVYLTTWFSELNIDTNRVDDILAMVQEEMQVRLS